MSTSVKILKNLILLNQDERENKFMYQDV